GALWCARADLVAHDRNRAPGDASALHHHPGVPRDLLCLLGGIVSSGQRVAAPFFVPCLARDDAAAWTDFHDRRIAAAHLPDSFSSRLVDNLSDRPADPGAGGKLL